MDALLKDIADYVHDFKIESQAALDTAHYILLDSVACALMALQHKECRKLLGPIVPNTKVPKGARVIGTQYELDPIKAAFDNGICIRWLDFNDAWLAKEWAHPSDNLGGILAVSDYVSRNSKQSLNMKAVLLAAIQAHEIQGVLSLDNAFNQVGLDHVILVKLATAAVTSKLWGMSKKETLAAISEVFVDGNSLRTYRHAPNTVQRKSWAAGDASSRGVFINWLVLHGEPGLSTPISAKRWGFSDAVFGGKPIQVPRPFGTYVMENILFKVQYPAEFHSQTALEAAIQLHQKYKKRLKEIERVEIETQEAGDRIINKTGPLHNYADRDHCIQYVVAIGLLKGDLTAKDYTDEVAKDPHIDALREKMTVKENKTYSKNYLDPEKRGIGNSVQLFFKNGDKSEKVEIEYPLGHKRRRKEALPFLKAKYKNAIEAHFNKEGSNLLKWWDDKELLSQLTVDKFMTTLADEVNSSYE